MSQLTFRLSMFNVQNRNKAPRNSQSLLTATKNQFNFLRTTWRTAHTHSVDNNFLRFVSVVIHSFRFAGICAMRMFARLIIPGESVIALVIRYGAFIHIFFRGMMYFDGDNVCTHTRWRVVCPFWTRLLALKCNVEWLGKFGKTHVWLRF